MDAGTGIARPGFLWRGPAKEGERAAHYEVIGLHDEVMPKICYIELYKAELDSSYADSLEATAPANTYKTLQAELTEAEASMTEWMQKFQPPAAGDDVEKALGYLNKELVRVNGVKSKIETAIKNAQQRIPLSPEKLKACETRQAHSQQP